jgi:hypothetical protein
MRKLSPNKWTPVSELVFDKETILEGWYGVTVEDVDVEGNDVELGEIVLLRYDGDNPAHVCVDARHNFTVDEFKQYYVRITGPIVLPPIPHDSGGTLRGGTNVKPLSKELDEAGDDLIDYVENNVDLWKYGQDGYDDWQKAFDEFNTVLIKAVEELMRHETETKKGEEDHATVI